MLDLTPFRSESCFCGAECECYLEVPYGARASWTEGKRLATQAVDVYLPRRPDGGVRPLVLWAHPNGSTKAVGSGAVGTELALPLLQEGYAFASAEFRHPAVNEGAPATDLAEAIQFLRCHAEPLGLDGDRFAGVGRSRGTLLVWTAVQDDLARAESADPVARASTRLRGVWAINAQTSYWGEWIAQTFFDAASRPLVVAALGPENRGHAVGDVSAGDPPLHFVYDSPLVDLPLSADDCQSLGSGSLDCVHLPNFGERACAAYVAAGLNDRCTAEYERPANDLYRAGPWLRTVLSP